MNETATDTSGSLKPVPAVMRAAAILDCVALSVLERGQGLKLSDIVRLTKLPKSSVHGLCHTLVHLNLLEMEAGGHYCMGPQSLRWAQAFQSGSDIVEAFQVVVAQARELDAYTLTLSHMDGSDVIYQACRNSNAPLGITFRVGMRVPAVFTATGKAMLATMPEPARMQHLPAKWPAPLTPASVTSLHAFEAEMTDVQARGYSLDNGQLREGMFCIGAAIVDGADRPVAGIGLSLMAAEAHTEVLEDLGRRVRSLSDQISARLGHV